MENTIKELKQLKDMTCGYEESLDKAIAAAEKQIAKKSIIVHPIQEDDGGAIACAICKAGALVQKIDKFCWNCGQKIDWSDYES